MQSVPVIFEKNSAFLHDENMVGGNCLFLKSVEMIGFKSFADKIYLDFNPGITAIVGPNGSGKSNISDAIRWVMGEQSIKTLRGSRMEDVIFAGTEKRKAQGFAEVSLTLDNSQKMFSSEFEEITVTRRVYRNGDGEYYINKAQCRLKDIHELFMDTGLGREGYSIIGQGKIDEILSNKSEDRRQIFEEAAGITKYKYRKNDAEKKLEKTNDNLTRVRDIMIELEGQIEPLRVQSEKAKKYLNIREELKGVEVNLSVAVIDKLKKEIEEVDKELDAVSESISKMQHEADDIDNSTREMYEQINECEVRMDEYREAQKRATEEANEKNNQINLLNATIQHCRENIERIQGEIEKSERGTKHLDDLIEEHSKTLNSLKDENEKISLKKNEIEAEFEKTNGVFENNNEEIEKIRTVIIDKSAQVNDFKSKIVNYNILIDNFKAGFENAQRELAEKKDDFERVSVENEELRKNLAHAESEFEDAKEKASAFEIKYREMTEKSKELVDKKNDILANLSQKSTRHNALEDMENDFEGYNRAVKSVMLAHKEGKIDGTKIHGPISYLVKTVKEYVVAIETALASVGQNIVTGDEQDAKKAIEYLKENRLGRATFMPISTIKARVLDISSAQKMKGYISVADELVTYDAEYEKIVKNVLGTTVVADNIDNAILMAANCNHRFKIVTLDGEVMQPGGAMTGGSNKNNTGLLSRASEIEGLKNDIQRLEAELNNVLSCIEMNSADLITVEEEREKERANISLLNEKYVKIKADFEHSELYLTEFKRSREQLLSEINTITDRISEINKDIENSNAEIKKLENEIEEFRKNAEEMQINSESLSEKVNEIQDALIKISIEFNANLKDIELQHERIKSVQTEKEEILSENKEKQHSIEEFNNKIVSLEAEIEQQKRHVESISKSSVDYDKEIQILDIKRKETDAKTKELGLRVREINEVLFTLGQKKVKIETAKAKAEEKLDETFAYLWDEYELTYSEAVKFSTESDVDIKKANAIISELKGKIKALGNINIDAIEEYKEVKERFEFLTAQTEDLEKAKADLEKIISEMLEIMKKQFSEQFAVISKNFNNVFRELFGGGQANLYLADPNDILSSGIEIEAQPPGKKLQSLTLLSGGERAFTAIALLFAILKVRPTPFCILDEIEAALDDINVYRYADYLKKYSKKTQFIVVTHRRGTMEAANILYGVTMQERGISKLLSLNIDEVTE